MSSSTPRRTRAQRSRSTTEKLVKLEFATKEPSPAHARIICQVMYAAAATNGLGLPSRSILYLDVPRGCTHKGARAGARTNAEITAACQTLADIWNTI